jgi:hypothetical protein
MADHIYKLECGTLLDLRKVGAITNISEPTHYHRYYSYDIHIEGNIIIVEFKDEEHIKSSREKLTAAWDWVSIT